MTLAGAAEPDEDGGFNQRSDMVEFARLFSVLLVVEDTARLFSGLGGDNEKLAYAVMKRGLTMDDLAAAASPLDLADLGLRFDLTVPFARFVVELDVDVAVGKLQLKLHTVQLSRSIARQAMTHRDHNSDT